MSLSSRLRCYGVLPSAENRFTVELSGERVGSQQIRVQWYCSSFEWYYLRWKLVHSQWANIAARFSRARINQLSIRYALPLQGPLGLPPRFAIGHFIAKLARNPSPLPHWWRDCWIWIWLELQYWGFLMEIVREFYFFEVEYKTYE